MEDVLSRWRAAAGEWAQFLKPSLLVGADASALAAVPAADVDWAPAAEQTALVIDLPARKSIAMGLALAARGYCPVPMFNTTHDLAELIPTAELMALLAGAAARLPKREKGPPAFLLDVERQRPVRQQADGDYDNRWYVFKSDFPSAALLSARGIREILLVVASADVEADLRNAFAEHAALFRSILDPVSMNKVEFPKASLGIARLLVDFSRALERNQDGTFGKRVVSHG